MAHYLLEYAYPSDVLERRAPHRAQHLALIGQAADRGELVLAGALTDPVDRGVLVWAVDDRATVEAFVEADPYVAQGVVSSWSLREWNVVGGTAAAG